MAQNLTLEKLLPFEPDPAQAGEGAEVADGGTAVDYIYEQPPAELFAELLPRYVEVQMFRAMAESVGRRNTPRA